MNVHKNARMTVFGRERLVKQVLERVLTPAAAAAAAGVSRRTVYKLLARYRKEGAAGLCDRGSRPKRLRCALGAKQCQLIERLRRERRPYREIAKCGSRRTALAEYCAPGGEPGTCGMRRHLRRRLAITSHAW